MLSMLRFSINDINLLVILNLWTFHRPCHLPVLHGNGGNRHRLIHILHLLNTLCLLVIYLISFFLSFLLCTSLPNSLEFTTISYSCIHRASCITLVQPLGAPVSLFPIFPSLSLHPHISLYAHVSFLFHRSLPPSLLPPCSSCSPPVHQPSHFQTPQLIFPLKRRCCRKLQITHKPNFFLPA